MSGENQFPMDIQVAAGEAIETHRKAPGAALGNYDHMHHAIASAILAERERCARIVRAGWSDEAWEVGFNGAGIGEAIIQKIREGGEA